MTAKRIGYAVGAAVLLSSGSYIFVYLYRWEWNRALMAAALFVATEVALLAAVVLERLRSLHAAVDDLRTRKPAPQVLERIRESAPAPPEHFAWLKPDSSSFGVFVPVLMGAGILLSGLAWLVERIASRTATPALEHGLAARLGALGLPDGLLDPQPEGDAALLLGPSWAVDR